MKMMKNVFTLVAVLVLSACYGGESLKTLRISGQTMGTTYNITAVGVSGEISAQDLTAQVEAVLSDVNSKMSNWDKNSEVSLFNLSTQTTPIKVSGDFLHVMSAANTVHTLSDQKFDVTLGPLIELWGFGPRKPEDPIPSNEAIETALAAVGQTQVLSFDEAASTITKSDPSVGINLSAIAKGFGIDAVADKLEELKIKDYMVEIGGDLIVSGKNDKSAAWRVGIEKPDPAQKAVELIVSLEDKSLATSGDYRNFVEYDGVRYSHIINPVTGRPITHNTTSVSVVADSAMMADAWATAMLVLGQEEGMKIAEANEIAVYFISRSGNLGDEEYVTNASSTFDKLLHRN